MDISKVDKSHLALLNIYGSFSIRTNLFPQYESILHIFSALLT